MTDMFSPVVFGDLERRYQASYESWAIVTLRLAFGGQVLPTSTAAKHQLFRDEVSRVQLYRSDEELKANAYGFLADGTAAGGGPTPHPHAAVGVNAVTEDDLGIVHSDEE